MNEDTVPSPGASAREYAAFISYRHADNKEPGRKWASWLHRSLETYEVPRELVGKLNSRDETIPKRIFPVFRDEEELPADAELSKPIERAIASSRFMVVLCSPHAVVSRFVNDEIVRFKTQRGENKDRILAVIIAGDPAGEEVTAIDEISDIPYARRQCFPRPLRYQVASDGSLTEVATSPIAPDFRLANGEEGFTRIEAYTGATEADITEYAKRIELMKLKIIAGILGISLGTLSSREEAYQRETRLDQAAKEGLFRRSVAEGLRESIGRAALNPFSWTSIKWRIEGWLKRKSFAEVFLLHSMVYRVEQLYLIHRGTGLQLLHVQTDAFNEKNADEIGARSALIKEFASESAIDQFQIGEIAIWMIRGRDALLAAFIRGNPPLALRGELEDVLTKVHRLFSSPLADFAGDTSIFESLRPEMEECLRAKYREQPK